MIAKLLMLALHDFGLHSYDDFAENGCMISLSVKFLHDLSDSYCYFNNENNNLNRHFNS